MRRLALTFAAVLVAGAVAVTSSSGSDVQAPRRGGTAVVALGAPTCLNPFLPCSLTVTAGVLGQVLEGAFEIGPDLTYRPDLVSRVDTVSKQPFTLEYHIKPQARWSDGTPVTASDFVFTYRAFGTVPSGFVSSSFDPFGESRGKIRTVVASGTKTFRVSFRSTFAGWRELFHSVLPRHALAGEKLTKVWRETIDNPKTGEPIGSGPFLVERLVPGQQLSLVRNARYWGPHTAYLDRIVFRPPPADPVEAFRSGQVDVVVPSSAEAALALQAQPTVRASVRPGSLWEHLELRLGAQGHPALTSPLVRRALAYGVDREALVRTELKVLDYPVLDSAVFPTQSRFYRPHWKLYRYQPAEARRLLEQAGCRRGSDGIYSCGDKRLSLRFVTTAGSPFRELTLRLVEAQLRRIGVEAVLAFAPPDTLFGTIVPSGDFDVVLFSLLSGADPGSSVEIFRCKGPLNHTGYCNRQVSRDLLGSDHVLDPRARAALLNRVDRQLAADVPVIPLFQFPDSAAFRATLRNVVPNSPPDYLTWNSEEWWRVR